MRHSIIALAIAAPIVLTGCQTKPPPDAFKLTEATLEARQLETRFYETDQEAKLLAAGIAVLQDLGYTVEEAEKSAGLVTASKVVDATDGGQVALAIFGALLGANIAIDTVQNIRVSFVTFPSQTRDGYLSRITFQRVVQNSQGGSRAETLSFPELYTEFFDKLSKSVFLEAQEI